MSPLRSRALFVTGTGTGVGKSIVAAAIVHALDGAEGMRVAAFKPAVSGLDEPDPGWPMDHELLAAATGWQTPERGHAVHVRPGGLAAPRRRAGRDGDRRSTALRSRLRRRRGRQPSVTVCEGVGGLMVPLATIHRYSVLDFAKALALPVVVATHPGLGTISDTRLTVDRAASRGLRGRRRRALGLARRSVGDRAVEPRHARRTAARCRRDAAASTTPESLRGDACRLDLAGSTRVAIRPSD